MIQVWDNAGCDERVAIVVEINAPRITGSMSEDFENMFGRMITPYTCVKRLTLFIFTAWLAHT
jgi:hypothetical protein